MVRYRINSVQHGTKDRVDGTSVRTRPDVLRHTHVLHTIQMFGILGGTNGTRPCHIFIRICFKLKIVIKTSRNTKDSLLGRFPGEHTGRLTNDKCYAYMDLFGSIQNLKSKIRICTNKFGRSCIQSDGLNALINSFVRRYKTNNCI